MKRAVPALQRAFGLVLLITLFTAVPGLMANAQAVSGPSVGQGNVVFFPDIQVADPPPPQSPQQIVYSNLQTEVFGTLGDYFNTAAAYRNQYLSFMYSQQLLGRDTTELQNVLNNFDSYITQGQAGQTAAEAAVGGDPGLDLSGNVTNPDQYNSSVQSALSNDWVARNFLNLATYQLHSGLLQYQYTWGSNVGIPDIPKWHLTPYQLPS